MKLTIAQALQKGVEAHRGGRRQEAERFYRAILRSQPSHPDANHNLGVLTVSVNKADAALPLFKTALEANPKLEQFWLSYIDALIKEKQFDNAKQVLEQAKKQGVDGEKLNVLETKLTPTAQVHEPRSIPQSKNLKFLEKRKKLAERKKQKRAIKQNLQANNPSQEQLISLLEHYQNERFAEAEKLAVSITQEFPEHPFGWKVLGAVLKHKGRISESLSAIQKSVNLEPQDAEAHSNLGNTLQELGRLDEAEASYNQAIALKPDFVEARSNLGITLQALGRLDDAQVSYRQAIALKPDYVDAHYNLGNTLKELGRLDEAEVSYKQAIALKPDYAEAENNLGVTLQALGRLDDAEVSYKQAIALKPDYVDPHSNLGNTLNELGRLDDAEASYKQAIALNPGYAEAHSNLGNTLKALGRLDEAEASYRQAIALKPDYAQAHDNLLMGLYRSDKKVLFFDELDHLIKQNKANAVIGSFTCRSALKYGVEKPNIFCNEPIKYTSHINLNTLCDFEKIFVKRARSILDENRLSSRIQPLLVNGYQTSGNLFDIQNDVTDKMQKVIRLEIEKYQNNFKDSEEGLIKKWPTEYSLYGWLISMKSGGELQHHIHESGWLSGSVYINVPPKSKADSGNFVVSLGHEEDAVDGRINVEKEIDVVTGSLVLFPASLTHYTIPFESEEERIVLAFDVKQK